MRKYKWYLIEELKPADIGGIIIPGMRYTPIGIIKNPTPYLDEIIDIGHNTKAAKYRAIPIEELKSN